MDKEAGMRTGGDEVKEVGEDLSEEDMQKRDGNTDRKGRNNKTLSTRNLLLTHTSHNLQKYNTSFV